MYKLNMKYIVLGYLYIKYNVIVKILFREKTIMNSVGSCAKKI